MRKEQIDEIKNRLGDVEITEKTVTKNNGVEMHGVIISTKDSNIAPTIYIDDVAEDKVVDYVVETYESCDKNPIDEDASKYTTREFILEHVVPNLVNREKNSGLMSDYIHEPFLDMEIMYRVMIDNDTSYRLTTAMAEYRELTLDELYEASVQNIKDCENITNLADFISQRMGEPIESNVDIFIVRDYRDLYGASIILNDSVLDDIRFNKYDGEDFYVIPSSVHEVLTIPCSYGEKEWLKELVQIVNAQELTEEDVLTDSVYIYRGKELEVA